MWRSATRWRRWSHSPRGSSEKQIFGNCVLPKNGANQVLARLLLESGFLLLHESPIGGLQILLGIEFCLNSPFRQGDQGTAHGKLSLFGNAPERAHKWRGNGNALTDRLGPGGAVHILGSARHTSMLADSASVWCRLGQMRSWQAKAPAPRLQTRDLPWWRRRFRLRTSFSHGFFGSAFLTSEHQLDKRIQRGGKRNTHHAVLADDAGGFEHGCVGDGQRDQGAKTLFEVQGRLRRRATRHQLEIRGIGGIEGKRDVLGTAQQIVDIRQVAL